ncbi:MAG TPA: response regulator transcription factor [Opitutaceae bacterium]|nr:response regulator transcription factor [Opitutaceae bacterium]
MKPIRLAVVGTDQLMRDFLRQTLPAVEKRFTCVVDLLCGEDTIGQCREVAPDLVVFDMGSRNAVELTALHHLAEPATTWALLVIASSVPGYLLDHLIGRKACGILSRSNSLDVLARAAFLVASGGTFFDATLNAMLFQRTRAIRPAAPPLSQRERHVLQLVAEGYSTKEVASLLQLSIKTVDKYRTSVMQKLNVHDVVKLTHCAIRMGLVKLT